MRKRIIAPPPGTIRSRAEGWLDVERAAIVEITSEDQDYPVESAFVLGEARGWRAAEPGPLSRLRYNHEFTESHREPVGSSPPKLDDLRRFYGAFDPIILPGAAYGKRRDGDCAAEYRSLADGRALARETMAVLLKCL